MNLHHICPNRYRINCYEWLWIYLTVFVLMTIQAQGKEVTTSCDIPSVFEKQNAMLTCRFGMDISTLLRNIKVIHYPSNDKQAKEVIALCHWSKGQAICQTKTGYQLFGNVSSTLSLKILNVEPSKAGGYTCHVYHSQLENVEMCNFAIIVPSAVSVSTDVTDPAKHSTLDASGGNCGRSDPDSMITNAEIFMGVTLILETLALICAILYIIRLITTKKRRQEER